MMYANKLAVAIKANGKVLREFKDTVYVPFGTEYTLLIKNLNTVRAQVKVSIDNTDATEGTWLVIPANGEVEVERFIKSGNLNKGNKFKFIERTSKIEAGPRGIKVDDGLIRIEYQFEKVYKYEPAPVYHLLPQTRWVEKRHWELETAYYAQPFNGDPTGKMGSMSGSLGTGIQSYGPLMNASSVTAGSASLAGGSVSATVLHNAANSIATASASFSAPIEAAAAAAGFKSLVPSSGSNVLRSKKTSLVVSDSPKEVENEAGITVAGGVSDQKFEAVGWFPVETEKHAMIIKLLGETESGTPIVKPVTVKSKAKCVTCDHLNKANAKFCSECGTGLVLV